MKRTTLISIAASLAAMMSLATSAQSLVVTVTNKSQNQRQELVSVDTKTVNEKLGLKKGDTFIVKNALGQQVTYQVTYDNQLVFDASVRPKGKAEFTITKGTPQEMKTIVCGKQYPERVDDIAWENDRTAYRLYGPALQRSGEKAFGIDVWVKNTPDLEVDKRYVTELSNHPKIEALKKEGKTDEAKLMEQLTTYHYDHGYGLDCYKVGPTLGCGAPALMLDGKLILPYCYKKYRILDNGPLRFTVELEYNPVAIGNDKAVVEHRILSLDKGTNFNKMTVWYEGLSTPCDMATGVVVHSEDTESVVLGDDYVLYADPTDNPAGQNFQIYVGALFPNGVKTTKKLINDNQTNGIAGHILGIITYQPGEKYTYYFGSAWSKNDVRTLNEWTLRSKETLEALRNPLEVQVK